MCGIAGLFHLAVAKPVDPVRIAAMTDAMVHRGPDGGGEWTAQGIGLGHRRLAVIDVAGSPQPMVSADGRFVLVYNGEIYNFLDLRRELEGLGHVFTTEGDTEVILHGWRQWGQGLLPRLNGMFAFALHDARDQSLILVRDRLGVKPLYYTLLADGSLAFASELKGLLALPNLRRQIDLRAVEDYFAFGFVPDDACILAGVHKLAAGHVMTLVRGRALPAPQSWWTLDFSNRIRVSAPEASEELLALLQSAVRMRMIADVPLGAFLSGGVDSSAVIALMAEASRTAVRSCSIGFDTAALDESRYADLVARRFVTDHDRRMVTPDAFMLIDRLVAAYDEPFADASALPTYRVCALARERVTVALSGDGADEAFAGYRRHRFQAAEEQVRALMPAGFRRKILGGLGRLYPKADWAPRPLRAKTTLLGLARDGDEAYARSLGVIAPEMRARLFSPGFRKALDGHGAEDRVLVAMRAAPARDPLDRAQYADLKITLPGDILTKVDRASMAVSLEAREPLLDYRLIEFAATLPPAFRLRRGEGKWVLKKTMEPYLPREILYRPKMGFVTPISAWFRKDLVPAAEQAARALETTGWFNPGIFDQALADHRRGTADHGRLLWQAVMLEKALARLGL